MLWGGTLPAISRKLPKPHQLVAVVASNGSGPAAGGSGHYFSGKYRKLLLKFQPGHTLRPLKYHIFQARVFFLHTLQEFYKLIRRAAEPGLLLHPVFDPWNSSRSAGGPPGASFGIGVADKTKRSEPFVPLVVIGTHPTDGFFLSIR